MTTENNSSAKTTNLNAWTVCGNLVDDLKVNPEHPNIAEFRIANNFGTDASGEVQTGFFTFAYNGEARINEMRGRLTKGSFVKVEAVVGMDEWETPEGGRRSKVTFSAKRVEVISQK